MIIKMSLPDLVRYCEATGKKIEDVYRCVVLKRVDGMLEMDSLSPDFPKEVLEGTPLEQIEALGEGVGTELKKVLTNYLGIKTKPGCKCNRHVKRMNREGADWCEENKDMIAGWLAEEAQRRKLPFVKGVVLKMISFAIWRYRRKENQ